MLLNIIGTQRSGSNLLRVMLNAHPQISAPHPPHILSNFFPIIHHYGPLNIPANFTTLATDVCDFVKHNRVPWTSGVPDAQTLVSLCKHPDLFHLFYSLHYYKGSSEGKNIFVNKSMSDYSFAKQFEQMAIKPRYIHLVRDGKATAHSFMKSPIGDKHPYVIGKKWAYDQEACLKLESEIPPQRFIRVRYEALITDPQKTLRAICDHFEMEYNEDMIRYNETQEAKITSAAGPLWEHLINKPMIEKANSSGFLSNEQCCLFEAAAGETQKKLGYSASCIKPAMTDCLDEDLIMEENKQLKILMKTGNSISDQQIEILKRRINY